jgi:hypothetical protein
MFLLLEMGVFASIQFMQGCEECAVAMTPVAVVKYINYRENARRLATKRKITARRTVDGWLF